MILNLWIFVLCCGYNPVMFFFFFTQIVLFLTIRNFFGLTSVPCDMHPFNSEYLTFWHHTPLFTYKGRQLGTLSVTFIFFKMLKQVNIYPLRLYSGTINASGCLCFTLYQALNCFETKLVILKNLRFPVFFTLHKGDCLSTSVYHHLNNS